MRMKKFIAVLSMVSMLAVAATGCGSDSKAGDTAEANADTKTEQESASWDSSYDDDSSRRRVRDRIYFTRITGRQCEGLKNRRCRGNR